MIVETRHRLREWGKWSQGGAPQLSSMFGALFGPGSSSCFMPAHIQEIDGIVCRSGPEYRGVLVQFYTRGGTIREKAFVLGIPKSTLKSRLDRAEWYVNTELDGVGQDAL